MSTEEQPVIDTTEDMIIAENIDGQTEINEQASNDGTFLGYDDVKTDYIEPRKPRKGARIIGGATVLGLVAGGAFLFTKSSDDNETAAKSATPAVTAEPITSQSAELIPGTTPDTPTSTTEAAAQTTEAEVLITPTTPETPETPDIETLTVGDNPVFLGNGYEPNKFDVSSLMMDFPVDYTEQDLANFDKMLATISEDVTYGYNSSNWAIITAVLGNLPQVEHSQKVQEVYDYQVNVDKNYKYGWKVQAYEGQEGWWYVEDGVVNAAIEIFHNDGGSLDENDWVSDGVVIATFDKTMNYTDNPDGSVSQIEFWRLKDYPL